MVIETDKLPEVIFFYKTWNSGPEQLWSLCVWILLGFFNAKPRALISHGGQQTIFIVSS